MRNILKISLFIFGVFLVDAKMQTLSACTPGKKSQYLTTLTDCSKEKLGTLDCQLGAAIYGWSYGCVSKSDEELIFGSNERAHKFKKYLGDKLPKESNSPKEEANNLFEEYKKFKSTQNH